MNSLQVNDTICALATPMGTGAIAVVRVSGNRSLEAVSQLFIPAGPKNLLEIAGHQAVFGRMKDGEQLLDEVLLTVFRAPRSFTGEDGVEISCHASPYIIQRLLQLLHEQQIRLAKPGEFTQRAFLNGRMDLSQAEAIADLIAAENQAAHRVALDQLRGGFSGKLKQLRQELIDFAALVELELDFTEEDVEFVDRSQLLALLNRLEKEIERLSTSFATGQAIKEGIPVAIVGEPNVGKSTLLNALFQEEKALVSDIAGTTRDSIEDTLVLDGLKFRFIDTAGIRETTDHVEQLGIARTFEKIRRAAMVLYMVDLGMPLTGHVQALERIRQEAGDRPVLIVLNKRDRFGSEEAEAMLQSEGRLLVISAREELGLHELREALLEECRLHYRFQEEVIVTNVRHQGELQAAGVALQAVHRGLTEGLSGEFIAMDIRLALEHLGHITGEIGTEELLGSIFSRFCIGK